MQNRPIALAWNVSENSFVEHFLFIHIVFMVSIGNIALYTTINNTCYDYNFHKFDGCLSV